MEPYTLLALIVFIASFIGILTNKIHRTIAVWIGCIAMLVIGRYYNVLNENNFFSFIDFNVLGLLLGMMIMVAILEFSGFFEFAAVKVAKISKGKKWLLLVLLGTLTTLMSLVVDNTTAIIIIAPLTIKIANRLNISAIPLLMSEALLSNIGGVATLIGDPPNIMIGSAANFSFNSFIIHLGLPVLIAWLVTLSCMKFFYKDLDNRGLKSEVLDIDEWTLVKNKKMMFLSLSVLAFTITLFILNDYFLHLQIATIGLIGAGLSLAINLPEIGEVTKNIEWSVLLFFAGLFILVGSIDKLGVLRAIGGGLLSASKGNTVYATILILWVSAFISSVIDNVPFTAAMIPIIKEMGLHGIPTTPLFWALALGVGFGGNGTPIGSTAGVVTVSLSEKTKHAISAKEWLRVGTPVMILTCVVSTIFLLLLKDFFMTT
ncbi:MAG: ArsB/NhaD family transporter [Thermoplasmata archaeon]|nr:ArsB/NhaD family transporter [Thermoplasmata archaeon]